MVDQSLFAAERLKIGSVLERSYAILLGNLSSLFVVALATTSLGFVFSQAWLFFGSTALLQASVPPYALVAFSMPSTIVDSVLASIAAGFIVHGTLCELQGRPVGLREVFRRGLAALKPVALLALTETLAVLIGFVVLVVPGLILGVWFWVAVPVTVIERRGVMASLVRSRDLTAGSRWPIFVLLVLSLATTVGFVYGLTIVVDYRTAFWRSLATELGGGSLLVAFWAVVSAVSYFDLKRIKEGAGSDEMAGVFD